MVKLEKRVQQAIKEILEEETWKHLKTNNNFNKVLSIASLIDKYEQGLDPQLTTNSYAGFLLTFLKSVWCLLQ